MTPGVARLTGVEKTFRRGGEIVHALHGVDLVVDPGEVVALMGPSGSGKSTLLAVLAGWEQADAGSVVISPELGGGDLTGVPWHDVAVVPQALGLLEDLTVRENVELPARLTGRPEAYAAVDHILELLDMRHLSERRPAETSLGEQQRTAVARALVLQPRLVLADEPTAHQDHVRAVRVFEMLRRAAEQGTAVVMATHDPVAPEYADRVVRLRDGRPVPEPADEPA